MTVAGAALRTIVVCSVVSVAFSVNEPCPTGTRVHSLSVWNGDWIDGLIMRCTGGSADELIPPEYYDEKGGEQDDGICAGTAGLQSIEWHTPKTLDKVMVYVNITCMDGTTQPLATGKPYDDWGGTNTSQTTCDDGEYVHGLTYAIEYTEEDEDYPYYISAIDFMCSSLTLDPICTSCSGDTTLRKDEDLPEYCESASCTEDECCESVESEGMTDDIIVGVVTTVIAAMILSGSAWAYKKFKVNRKGGRATEGANEEDLRVPRI